MKVPSSAAALCVCAVAALGVAGCGTSSNAPKGANKVAVTLVDSGCTPQQIHVAAGPVSFDVSNGGTSKVSEMELKNASGIILGESENVVEGVPGQLLAEPQARQVRRQLPDRRHGGSGTSGRDRHGRRPADRRLGALLTKATTAYKAYVIAQTAALQKETQQFVAALQAGDVEQAKALFGPARIHYETVEPVAESFGNLDPEIDARINDVAKRQGLDGLSPDRADPVGAEHDRRHRGLREPS